MSQQGIYFVADQKLVNELVSRWPADCDALHFFSDPTFDEAEAFLISVASRWSPKLRELVPGSRDLSWEAIRFGCGVDGWDLSGALYALQDTSVGVSDDEHALGHRLYFISHEF